MTTLGDLASQVRGALKDWPKLRADQATGDGSTLTYDLGKDLGIITNSDTVLVGGIPKTRTTDYSIDYDASQITFVAAPPTGTTITVRYKEAVWRDERIHEGINAGRRMLFQRFYQIGAATVTVRNLVREYDLTTTDVVEAASRTIFAGQQFAVLRGEYQIAGTTDGRYIPFRKFDLSGKKLHLWRLLPADATLRLHFIYDFKALAAAADVTDIPDQLHDLVVYWAIGALALKKEAERDRLDTANVLQGVNALPPGLQAQTADDFVQKWRIMRNAIPSRPPLFEARERPLPFEARGWR